VAKSAIDARNLVHRWEGERRARWRLRWRYDTAQGGVQGERVRESDVVIGLMHEWKESGKRDDGRA
jgi:hypothetical protein